MDKIIPPTLKKGATIGLLSVSGVIDDTGLLDLARIEIEKLGFNVKVSSTSYDKNNYMCANDKARAIAFNEFFADKSIDAIVATRGGYGAIRILNDIDYETVKNNPKIFCGYSDITALQLMLYKKTGLITYNAPMAVSDFSHGLSDYSKESFLSVLTKGINDIFIDSPFVFHSGFTEGILWGGNLSTIQSLCGQDFIPDEKFIFVAEDIEEPVYKIDKMFTQLLNILQFKENLSGIVLGDFTALDNSLYFDNYFSSLANELKIPIVSGLKFGHEKDKQTFPIGVYAVLDTNLSKILIK